MDHYIFTGSGGGSAADQEDREVDIDPETIERLSTELSVQQEISQQPISPGNSEPYVPGFTTSPNEFQAPPRQPDHVQYNNFFTTAAPNVSTPSMMRTHSAPYPGHVPSFVEPFVAYGAGFGYGGNLMLGNDAYGYANAPTRPLPFNNPSAGVAAVSTGGRATIPQLPLPEFSPRQISTTIEKAVPIPVAPVTPTAIPPRHKRRRKENKSPDSEVIGLILASGKFQCSKAECDKQEFGRHADFQRHYSQMHARHRAEYFCSVRNCDRSKKEGGGKSRGFGTRRDKRDEHMRNVHGKKEEISDPDAEQYSPESSL